MGTDQAIIAMVSYKKLFVTPPPVIFHNWILSFELDSHVYLITFTACLKLINILYRNTYHNALTRITLVNAKAPEITCNARMSAFSRTGAGGTLYQQSLKCLSALDSTLFVITHGARTIDKIAVYDIATNFMIYLMVYSVNH